MGRGIKVTEMKNKLLLALLILPPIVIFLTKYFLPSNYIFSSLYKIIFLFPIFYRVYTEKKSIKGAVSEHFSIKIFKQKILYSLFIGIGLFLVYFGAFLLFRHFLDFEEIKMQLGGIINLGNLVFIGLYIVIMNSLLEEFFWRGFIFDKLRSNRIFAYIVTGVAFSFHHVIFYYNWFNVPLFIVVTLGLILYAMFMNYIFEKFRDLFSCWIIHAFADVAQITIAFIVFI